MQTATVATDAEVGSLIQRVIGSKSDNYSRAEISEDWSKLKEQEGKIVSAVLLSVVKKRKVITYQINQFVEKMCACAWGVGIDPSWPGDCVCNRIIQLNLRYLKINW